MVKLFFILIGIILIAKAEPSGNLKNSCLNCHIQQQIPSELIYRRYLMRYSTDTKMRESMLKYLQNPKQELSIMPKQFFLKFPMKIGLDRNETILKVGVDEYLSYFDIKGKLLLP